MLFDVAKLLACEAFHGQIADRTIDILINNAGLASGLDRVQDADIADWEAMIDTNIKGLIYITRLFLPAMISRNSGHHYQRQVLLQDMRATRAGRYIAPVNTPYMRLPDR